MESTTPQCRSCRIAYSILQKVTQKMRESKDAGDSPASFEPTFMAIGKILDLSDKISAGGNIWGRFWKKSKKRKKCFQKKPILYCWWLKKYFFSKTKGEIDYSKCYKMISMPFSWYYIFFEHIQRDFGLHLPIIRIRIIKTKNSALKSDNALCMSVCNVWMYY